MVLLAGLTLSVLTATAELPDALPEELVELVELPVLLPVELLPPALVPVLLAVLFAVLVLEAADPAVLLELVLEPVLLELLLDPPPPPQEMRPTISRRAPKRRRLSDGFDIATPPCIFCASVPLAGLGKQAGV